MKEYGTSIQKLADYLKSISIRDQRTKYAHVLIELMRQIHPSMRVGEDYTKKLWDDLYIMCDFDLDVESPYPAPPKEILGKKPNIVPYNQSNVKFKFYGRSIELLVLKAIATSEPEEKRAFVSYIIRLMKQFYISWNRDTPEQHILLEHLSRMSNGLLQNEINEIKTSGLVDSAPKDTSNTKFQKQPLTSESKLKHDLHGGSHRNYRNNNNNNRNNNNRNNKFQKRRPQN
jgi:hypothetical protein